MINVQRDTHRPMVSAGQRPDHRDVSRVARLEMPELVNNFLPGAHAHIVQRAEETLEQALRSELEGIAVTRLVLRGDPAEEIVNTASDQNAGLIVMSTFGTGMFYRYLLGSVTAKVL